MFSYHLQLPKSLPRTQLGKYCSGLACKKTIVVENQIAQLPMHFCCYDAFEKLHAGYQGLGHVEAHALPLTKRMLATGQSHRAGQLCQELQGRNGQK
jgi:hypothetical protein